MIQNDLRKRIAIDLDNVVADWSTELCNRYNAKYGENLRPEDLTEWATHKIVRPDVGRDVYKLMQDDTFFYDLNIMPQAQEVIYELCKKYIVYIVTVPETISSIDQKIRWVEKHLPFVGKENMIFSFGKDKGFVNADYLIDDNPKNFNNFKGIKVLYTAPHNKDIQSREIVRVNDWDDIAYIFRVE